MQPPSDWIQPDMIALGTGKMVGPLAVTFLAAAIAADPAAVTPAAEFLVTKPTIVQGAIFGGLIFALIGHGSWPRRIARALASMLFSYMSSEGILEVASSWGWIKTTPAMERLVTMAFGIVGVLIAETWLGIAERARDRAGDIADKLIGEEHKVQ